MISEDQLIGQGNQLAYYRQAGRLTPTRAPHEGLLVRRRSRQHAALFWGLAGNAAIRLAD
jgi:hypothetical protein